METRTGVGVDSKGNSVVDPTTNVLNLVEAGNKRQDDLRASFEALMRTEMASIRSAMDLHAKSDDERHDLETASTAQRVAAAKELSELRAAHQREMDTKESDRLNSIRQVDREEVTKTAAAANLAIATLAKQTSDLATGIAKQTSDLATTLQNQVQNTAAAAETRRSVDMGEIGKRVSALELALSASAGKQTVEDPRMERLATLVDTLARNGAVGSGKSEGISAAMAAVVTAIGVIATVLTIYAFTQRGMGTTTFTPAPTTTTTTGAPAR